MPNEYKSQGLSLKELKRQLKKAAPMDNNIAIQDIYENCTNSKLIKKLKSGLIYDEKFEMHKCEWDLEYPENPKRYTCIMDRIKEYNLLDRCEKIPNRLATREEICSLHDPNHVDILENTTNIKDLSELESVASGYDAIYFNENTNMVSHLATGSVLNLVEAVVTNKVQNGMAVVRPPGHHAMHKAFCGYCYFNNVALAAQYALDKLNLNKVLIVDWDVHHGQATQQMFYDDPRVLYFSIHRYEFGEFWPNLRESNYDYIGKDKGIGYNINIPLNEINCGDAEYLAIFRTILLPVAYEFEPDLILISAGYDAGIGDNEGEMKVTPGCYHHLTTSLMGLAKGKVVAVLEGGYFLPSLAESAAQTLKALLGDPAPMLENLEKPKKSVMDTVFNSMILLREKWNCFSHYCANEVDKDRVKRAAEQSYCGVEGKPPFLTRNCYPTSTKEDVFLCDKEIARLKENYYQSNRVTKVGYVCDPIMELHKSPGLHNFETPERITRSLSILSELAIIDRMEMKTNRMATVEEIASVHNIYYINKILDMTDNTESDLKKKEGWTTVFTNDCTMESAAMAAGCLIKLVEAVLERQITFGVALIRPPGHHAEVDAASGFCIFNNVAIAASYALDLNVKRILIIDWDVHHGNGIQRMFYNDDRVLYMSLHRYDHKRFFPHSSDADPSKIGEGTGRGFNVNVAWNDVSMGDADYISAFFRVVLPIAYEFNPELVIVSAGFDACVGDPLGGYSVTPEAFGHFVQLLKPLAGGRIVLALEGGYNINSLGYSLALCCKALLNDPLPSLRNCGKVQTSAVESINQTISALQPFWLCLNKNDIVTE